MAAESYELVISGTLAGQFVQTVQHVNVNNVGAENPYVKALELLNTLNTTVSYFTQWCDVLPTSYTITSVRCRRILSAGGPTAILLGSSLGDSTGDRTGNISATQLNPVIVWITDPRAPKPGKTFLPGISETDIDAMVYTSGWITAVNTWIDTVTTDFVLDDSSDPASFSIYRRALAAADSIEHGRISPVVGTQRRRLHPV